MGQLPEDGQQAPNILQDVIDLSSDNENDEVIAHWPPGLQFLDDEGFILDNLHHNAAPAAWKQANYIFKDMTLHPNKCFFQLTAPSHSPWLRLRWTSSTQVNSIAGYHQNKGVNELSNLQFLFLFLAAE